MEPQNNTDTMTGSSARFNFIAQISHVWSFKRFIVITTLATAIVVAGVSFIVPPSFKSSTTLLPQAERSKLSALGGLSELASLAGMNLGADDGLARQYPAMIRSKAVLKDVIMREYKSVKLGRPANLIEIFEVPGDTPDERFQMALERLKDQLQVFLDPKTNLVTIGLETREPELSSAIVNGVAEELDRFIRFKKNNSASEQRKWIESRLTEVHDDLTKSENNLREFKEENRRIGDSPLLFLKSQQLAREVEINSTVYMELKKQLEIAKIEEIRNTPFIEIMDRAYPSAFRDSPNRRLMVTTAFVCALFGSILIVVLMKRFEGEIQQIPLGRNLQQMMERLNQTRRPASGIIENETNEVDQ